MENKNALHTHRMQTSRRARREKEAGKPEREKTQSQLDDWRCAVRACTAIDHIAITLLDWRCPIAPETASALFCTPAGVINLITTCTRIQCTHNRFNDFQIASISWCMSCYMRDFLSTKLPNHNKIEKIEGKPEHFWTLEQFWTKHFYFHEIVPFILLKKKKERESTSISNLIRIHKNQ